MLSKEEDGKVVGETKFFYKVQDENGEIHYKCKKCGEFVSKENLASHECVREEVEKSREEKQMSKQQSEIDEILEEADELTRAMAEELYDQLLITPGCGKSRDKLMWVIRWFVKSPQAKNNPATLYNVLNRTFPQATDEALNFIVDSVFQIKQNFQSKKGYRGTYGMEYGQQGAYFPPQPPMMPQPMGGYYQPADPVSMMTQLIELMDRLPKKTDEEVIRAKIENEMLREELKQLREQVNALMQRNSQPVRISDDSWNDDWAKLTYYTMREVREVLQTIISENKKFRQTLIRMLATAGAGAGSGKTDDDVLRELEKEGLVEEVVNE